MAPRTKTSFPGEKQPLRHFTHPHVLIKEDVLDQAVYENNEFVCDGCATLGTGARYHCKQCAFDLHEVCTTCPEYLTSYIHPNHPLERIWEGPGTDYGQWRPCNVCGDQVKGLFYKCASGAANRYDDGRHEFFIHPLCSKLELQVRHAIDQNHPLKLQSVPVIRDAWCAICRNLVSSSSWSYRCDPCGINIHPQCVTLPYHNYQSAPSYSSRENQSGPSCSSRKKVADAAADSEALYAEMISAKMMHIALDNGLSYI
ncbi:uncharacterized protein LOC113311619 [Papaver somniferum]|uniref:uncharacterized protein LOC113311619 n=1 Tax=Papaver somniferum TaxID=3469 RepID=UPI000E6FB279|nr:uncharacterized protein LOC113311619 [Papaver somniferum]